MHYSGDMQMVQSQTAKLMEWDKWCNAIPYIKFKPEWDVKVIPPRSGAVVRFWVKYGEAFVSVYLDCYDILGIYGEPYWEVYPFGDDVERCAMNDVEQLLKSIEYSLEEQLKNKENSLMNLKHKGEIMSNVKDLAAELAGVLYDVDSDTGFDATCRHTIERVKKALESSETFTEGVTADVFGYASLSLKLPVETIGFAVQDKEQLEVLLTNICFHAESVCDEDVIDALINSLVGFVNGTITYNTTPINNKHIARMKEIRKDWKELNDLSF